MCEPVVCPLLHDLALTIRHLRPAPKQESRRGLAVTRQTFCTRPVGFQPTAPKGDSFGQPAVSVPFRSERTLAGSGLERKKARHESTGLPHSLRDRYSSS
jgi:hypothetical protein